MHFGISAACTHASTGTETGYLVRFAVQCLQYKNILHPGPLFNEKTLDNAVLDNDQHRLSCWFGLLVWMFLITPKKMIKEKPKKKHQLMKTVPKKLRSTKTN